MDKETIDELYQSLILEHSKKPRNFGILEPCSCHQHGRNASCGDDLELYVNIKDDIITNIKFKGEGCALFMSSTSLMTQIMKHKNIKTSEKILVDFIQFILEDNIELKEEYEPLHIFNNIKNFPLRVKCVLLSWRTFESILIKNKYV